MRILIGLLLCGVLSAISLPVFAEQPDQLQHPACSYCGMDRVKFSHSRMLVRYQDGGEVGTCSIHCMALEFAQALGRVPAELLVADYHTHRLIDARKATWVLGGDQPGVMSMRAKWAFAEHVEAEGFIAAHGGTLSDFDGAMEATYADMYRDTLRMRKMRQMKKQSMSHDHGGD